MVCISVFQAAATAFGLFAAAGVIWLLGKEVLQCQEGKCQEGKLQTQDAKEQEGAEN